MIIIAISSKALYGWFLIIILFSLYGYSILRSIKNYSTRITCPLKIFLATVIMIFLFLFIQIVDQLATGRDYAHLYYYKTIQLALAERLLQYKKEHKEFPADIEELVNEGPVLMFSEKHVPLQYFEYKQPKAQDGRTIIVWDAQPTAISHFWIPWHDKVVRNVTFSDGVVETISEHKFISLYRQIRD